MAFIEQEANEKAEEIDAKAEEEFNIEKGRLVQQQRLKIMEYYEKKEKQVELQKKIQSSNMLNQARLKVKLQLICIIQKYFYYIFDVFLKVLKIREDHVASVLEDARRRLGEVTKNPSEYKQVLQKLILQALYQTMEKSVILRCRQVDVGLVNEVLPAAIDQYREQLKEDVVVTVDTDNYLPADTCGGIELIALNGRIKVS